MKNGGKIEKFSIPYTRGLKTILTELKNNDPEILNKISEIYFSDHLPSARFIVLNDQERNEIKEIKDKFGIRLNYLFNPAAFPNEFYLEKEFYEFFETLQKDFDFYKFDRITLTNTMLMNLPILRNFFDQNNIELKVSVNNQIDSLKKLQIYFYELHISNFVLDRSLNRNENELERCYEFAKENNIKLTLLLNEGCLPNCQYKQFCDQIISQQYRLNEKERNIVLNVHNALACHTNFMIFPEKGLQSPFILPIQLNYFNQKYDYFFEYKLSGRGKDYDVYKEILKAYLYKTNITLDKLFSVEKHPSFRYISSYDLLEYDFFDKVKNCKLECYSCPHKSNDKSFCKLIHDKIANI